jgi:hypothetical protein
MIFLFKNFSVSCFPLPLPSQKIGVHSYAHKSGSFTGEFLTFQHATLAKLVEQLICNQQVVGSSPTSGSHQFLNTELGRGRFQSGQMGRTVNPLSFDFRGSNPLLPTSEFENWLI